MRFQWLFKQKEFGDFEDFFDKKTFRHLQLPTFLFWCLKFILKVIQIKVTPTASQLEIYIAPKSFGKLLWAKLFGTFVQIKILRRRSIRRKLLAQFGYFWSSQNFLRFEESDRFWNKSNYRLAQDLWGNSIELRTARFKNG